MKSKRAKILNLTTTYTDTNTAKKADARVGDGTGYPNLGKAARSARDLLASGDTHRTDSIRLTARKSVNRTDAMTTSPKAVATRVTGGSNRK